MVAEVHRLFPAHYVNKALDCENMVSDFVSENEFVHLWGK